MPHLIIEHSANVDDVSRIVEGTHAATLATGIAAVDALRTRAAKREEYLIGDGHADNAFVAATLRLGPGRSDADKQTLIDAVMAAIDDAVGDARNHMMLSVEIQEIDPTMRLIRNYLRTAIAARNPDLSA